MICVLDYGVGNTKAFLNLFKRIGVRACAADTPELLMQASRIILPGVGHFDCAMNRLNNSGLRGPLEELVLESNIPLLGICVGMQMLAEGSDEGRLPGLDLIPGRVRSFAAHSKSAALPLPHMGWNQLKPSSNNILFSKGFVHDYQFYFLHSFFFEAADLSDVCATASYGFNFHAAVSRQHIHGVQFHPEKSHRWGEQLLSNFAEGS